MAEVLGDPAELHQHLAGPHRRVRGRAGELTDDQQERTIGALGALELTRLAGELGEHAHGIDVRAVHLLRDVELIERAVDLSLRLQHARQGEVHERAFCGPARAGAFDQAHEQRFGLVEAAGGELGLRPA